MEKKLTLIVGLGKTGLSIAHYLHKRGRPFIIFDTRENAPNLDDFINHYPGIPYYLVDMPESVLDTVNEVISSPGIPLEHPILKMCVSKNIPIIGDVACLMREISAPIIAITGTNGKSTVTTLVGLMAQKSGFKIAVAGNIGLPVLDALDNLVAVDLWVLELSSFQLDLIPEMKSRAATVLNISPDHLDRHHNMETYKQSKHHIYDNADFKLYCRDDELTYTHNATTSFGLSKPKSSHEWGIDTIQDITYLVHGSEILMPTTALKISGRHNWSNALAAAALATEVGISKQAIVEALQEFSGLAHRCEWVRSHDSVTYINDSKGTNVGAAQSAIEGIGSSITGKIVLIAGGLGKGADFSVLNDCISKYVRAVILIGQDASLIEKALDGCVYIEHASSLIDAVLASKKNAKPQDVVLLSPACASQDMFRDFNHRGEEFVECVRKLS